MGLTQIWAVVAGGADQSCLCLRKGLAWDPWAAMG